MRHSLFSTITLLTFAFMLTACSEAQRTDFEEEFETCDDGQTILNEQRCPEPSGSTKNADGTTTNPDGTITNLDGTITNLDGTITNLDGSITDTENGTITYPVGHSLYPEGRVTDLEGVEIFLASYEIAAAADMPTILTLPQAKDIPTYKNIKEEDVAYDSLTAILSDTSVTEEPLTLQGLAIRKIDVTEYTRQNVSSIWQVNVGEGEMSENVLNIEALQIDRKINLSAITAAALTLEFYSNRTIEKATLHLESNYIIDDSMVSDKTELSTDTISGTDAGLHATSTDDDVDITVDRNSVFGFTDGEGSNVSSNYMAYVSWTLHDAANLESDSTLETETRQDIAGAMIVGFETETIRENDTVTFTGRGKGSYGSVAKVIDDMTSYEDASVGYHTVFDVNATVDFENSTIGINSSGTMKCDDTTCTEAVSALDFMTPSITYKVNDINVNAISSDMVTTKQTGDVLVDNNLSGTLDARFYGGVSWELGGIFALTETNDTHALYYFGAFGAERATIDAPLQFDEEIADEMVSADIATKIETEIATNAYSHNSLPDVVSASGSNSFAMNGLAVIKNDATHYTRAPNRDWATEADTVQNISLARLAGVGASLTFDESGYIAGVTVYLKDNDYTAEITTPISGIKIDDASITLRNGTDAGGNDNDDFKFDTATISVDRSMALFGFDSDYMAYIGWDIIKTTAKFDANTEKFLLEDDTHNINGAMLAGIESAYVKNFGFDNVVFTGKGKGIYRSATDDYETVFVMNATVNFDEKKIKLYSNQTCKKGVLCSGNINNNALNFGDNEVIISYTGNNISFNVESNGFYDLDLSGTLDARFYGGINQELGGTFMLTNASTESYYYGVFGAKAENFVNKNTISDFQVVASVDSKVDNLLAIPHSVALAKITADNTISINKFTDAVVIFDYDVDGNFVSDAGVQLYFADKKYEISTGTGTDNTTIANNGANSTTSNDDDAPLALIFSRANGYFGGTSAQQYMALIHWQVNDDDGNGNTTYQSYAYGITGFETADAKLLSTTGTAVTFTGKGGGVYANATASYATQFTATATANFTNKEVTIGGSNTMKCDAQLGTCTTIAPDMLDFNTPTAISYTDNNISGNVALTNDTTFDGTINARFYGPATNGTSEELGGTFLMKSSDETAGYIGFFGAKKQ